MLGMHGSVPWIGTCHHPDTGRQRRRPTDIIPCKASREKFGRSYTLKVSNRVGLDWIYMELYVVLSPINGLITGVITPLTGVITLLITGGGPFLKQTFSVLQLVVQVSIQHIKIQQTPFFALLQEQGQLFPTGKYWWHILVSLLLNNFVGGWQKRIPMRTKYRPKQKDKKAGRIYQNLQSQLVRSFWFSDFAKKRTSRWFKGPRLTGFFKDPPGRGWPKIAPNGW